MNHLTAERLRYLLDYDRETGLFSWRIRRQGCPGIGSIAGRLDDKEYIRIKIDGKEYMAHRLAWMHAHGVWPVSQIDHVNRIRSQNNLANIREATPAENEQNKGLQRNNTSEYKGVSFFKSRGRWAARIHLNGKTHYLGIYKTPEDASEAYRTAAVDLHTHYPVMESA